MHSLNRSIKKDTEIWKQRQHRRVIQKLCFHVQKLLIEYNGVTLLDIAHFIEFKSTILGHTHEMEGYNLIRWMVNTGESESFNWRFYAFPKLSLCVDTLYKIARYRKKTTEHRKDRPTNITSRDKQNASKNEMKSLAPHLIDDS